MSSAMVQPPIAPPPMVDTNNSTQPPRKRRRRTAAGGATDDCFACRKRAVPCDRKRPYCTQCIDIGKECSGYKTTLTWGVGVASRGKLRGLSCPVANKNTDGSDSTPAAGAREVEVKRKKSTGPKLKVETIREGDSMSKQLPLPTSPAMLPPVSSQQSYPPTSVPMSIPTSGWQVDGFGNSSMVPRNTNASNATLQRIHTALGPHFDGNGFPTSANSVGSYAETEFHSPLEYPHTPGSMIFSDRYQQVMGPNYFEEPMNGLTSNPMDMNGISTDSYSQSLGSNLENLSNTTNYNSINTISPSQAELSNFNNLMFDENLMNTEDETADNDVKDLSLMNSRFGNPFYHLSPRLQCLITYYDRHICPFLVAFDSPANPYRMHVIQLATQNDGLQNAIAALATNNMRMRRKQTRTVGFVKEITEAFDSVTRDDTNEPSPEESCYKQMSIDQLNMQLIDPRAAQDDSVLATLLILCLFHVCDSGFSKFKTQLAGVQKLLSMRKPQTQSTFTGWVEMFFAWFDVMTSAVNDRESQIQGESLDLLDLSANLGALEQFCGCDGRLFKLIARLGRLNLLSQGRPVRFNVNKGRSAKSSGVPKRSGFMRSMKRKRPAVKSLSPLDYENVDGNGWGTPILSSDEDADGSAEDTNDANRPAYDERREFWTEWHDIRARLQAWQMDLSAVPSSSPTATFGNPTELAPEQRDLVHISESFRHSALLYTERLAHPLLPSSAPVFQCQVSQALYHITALPVTSCVNKFLLWPLFIAGTECVDEGHRNMIRTRCVEIQKESGFFNNISGLDVLERVWQDSSLGLGEDVEVKARRRDSEVGGRGGNWRQAFRWRRAMDRVDGEYIVI